MRNINSLYKIEKAKQKTYQKNLIEKKNVKKSYDKEISFFGENLNIFLFFYVTEIIFKIIFYFY